jgi:hypothetical protein
MCQENLGQRLVHYTSTVREHTVSIFSGPYYLHLAQKRNLGGHQFKDDGYLETLVTDGTQEAGRWQQGTEKLDARQVPEFLQGQYGKLPRGLRRESAIARFLGMRVRISPGAWIPLSSERCALSGTGL